MSNDTLPTFGGGPVSPQDEEFTFTGDGEEPKSKYDFQYDPKAAYNARTVGFTPSTGKESGLPLYIVEFLGVQGPIAGLKFKTWLPVQIIDKETGKPKPFFKTEKTLKNAYGVKQDEATKQIKFKKTDVLNKLVGLKFQDEMYNGKRQVKVADVVAAVEVTAEPTGSPGIPF